MTPLQAAEHIVAFKKIVEENLVSRPAEAQKYADEHNHHNVQREFNDAALDAAEEEYKVRGKPKKEKVKDKK